MSTAQLYQAVTDRIIAQLEAGGVPPWLKPWKDNKSTGGVLPANAITNRSYRGINVVILWDRAAAMAYPTPRWLTYKQAQEKGANVRKGERAIEVVFTKKLNVKDEKTEAAKQISMLKSFFVFNVAQIDGLPEVEAQTLPDLATRHHQAECLIAATDAKIQHGGNTACFIPSLDLIQMPPFGAFKSPDGYYATTLHELGHWCGHTTRLDRNLTGRFGTRAYAAEELVAEMTAAFLCASLGIEGDLRHAGYLAHWLELLKHDNRAIFSAAALAQKSADYITGIGEDEGQTATKLHHVIEGVCEDVH